MKDYETKYPQIVSIFILLVFSFLLISKTKEIQRLEETIKDLEKPKYINSVDTIYIIEENIPELSLSTAKSVIDTIGFDYPGIVYAQMRLESGNLTSNIVVNNNNLFGMKVPYKRETTGIKSTSNSYNLYSTWIESIKDRLIYENLFLKGLTKEEYYSYLDRNYAEDENYVAKLKSMDYE